MARGVNAERVKIDQRREQVGKLYLQRYTQMQIAEKMGVAQSTISDDIAALRAQWKANSVEDFEGVKLREAAELDEMETIAAQLFERQKQIEWFTQRLKVKERRAKLLGLDEPTRTESSGPRGGPLEVNLSGEVTTQLTINDARNRPQDL